MDSEITQDEIIVSFDGVKMKDFRTYWTAVARGDWAGQDTFFASVVRSWPHDLDPADRIRVEPLDGCQVLIEDDSGDSGVLKPCFRQVGVNWVAVRAKRD